MARWMAGARARKEARFSTTKHSPIGARPQELSVADGVGRVLGELEHLNVAHGDAIISTNVPLRLDGTPRSNQPEPIDPGAAVYWRSRGQKQTKVMAVDRYDRVADNLAAIAATLNAMRAIERHGGAQILKRAFQGFRALPASTTPALSAREAAAVVARRSGADDEDTVDLILDDREWAKEGVRRAVKRTHPDSPDRTDRGGSTDDYMLVQEAKRVLEAHHGVTL